MFQSSFSVSLMKMISSNLPDCRRKERPLDGCVGLMVVGAGQREREREGGERASERAATGEGFVYFCCYFAPPERTVGRKRRRERETMKA